MHVCVVVAWCRYLIGTLTMVFRGFIFTQEEADEAEYLSVAALSAK
jgi:hypothetical protein